MLVSAAKEAPKHPAPKVVNAYMRRGAKVLATQGVSIRHHFNAGSRAGWVTATPLSFFHEMEED